MSSGVRLHSIELDRPDAPLIHADIHVPEHPPVGTVLVAHGFMGYKDYGMLPRIGRKIAESGWAAVAFNFAHSGMSRDTDTFTRPDLFAESTWNRQVEDLEFMQDAIRDGRLPGTDPEGSLVLLGHSRGGTAVLLAAGRASIGESSARIPDGIVTLAAPAGTNRSTDEMHKAFMEHGHITVKSNRTGQSLKINRSFIDEIAEDKAGHDPVRCSALIGCPMLLAHGEDDPTISLSDLDRLAGASENNPGLQKLVISGGDHVLNVPNPLPHGHSSPQLDIFLEALRGFLDTVSR